MCLTKFHNLDDLCNRHINFTSGHQTVTLQTDWSHTCQRSLFCNGTATKEHRQCCLNNEERLTKERIIGSDSEYEFIKCQRKEATVLKMSEVIISLPFPISLK